MDYLEKLKDPRWQKKRLEILERDGWQCKLCHSKDKSLHVHHIHYIKGIEPWEMNSGFMITFCKDCHDYEREVWGDDSFIEEIGNILQSLWKSRYDTFDLINLSTAIEKAGIPPSCSPNDLEMELKYRIKDENEIKKS